MWQAFRQTAEEGRPLSAPDPLAALESAEEHPREDPGYYCRLCGELITHARARICVQGSHEHRFSNPAGYVFDIGCFRSAPGCQSAGEPSAFYSWFDGFSWRLALCRACGAHLGWAFGPVGGGEGEFFGLILNRLAAH